jgi:hypothetical protein
MKGPSSLPPPDTPSTLPKVIDLRTDFITKNNLTAAQLEAFDRLWNIISSASDGSSLEEIHEESAAA